ncbi:MAG TPA: hypothetical protein VGM30_10270 [Puia sp.]|jgi:hypothetical protein
MANPNKTSHCNEKSVTVYYTDSKHHFTLPYESNQIQDLQLHGNSFEGKSYQDRTPSLVFESDVFSPYQNRLYKDALHGLSMYTDKEIATMSFKDKLKIENLHKRAQRVLNEWKQSIVSKEVDDLLLSLFHKSTFLKKSIIERTKNYTNNALTNYQSFAELGISRIDIAKKLIEQGILPRVFFNLKTAAE